MRPPVAAPRSERPTSARETPIDEFEHMSPDEQRRALDHLPPERRKRFEEQLERYRSMTPEQRQAIAETYRRLNSLPPDRQEAVRKSFQNFSAQPSDRQQAMRDELRRLGGLTQKERKARMKTEEFRNGFTSDEKHMIHDMLELLPSTAEK